MYRRNDRHPVLIIPFMIAAVAALLIGAPPASAAKWRTCGGTPYYVQLKVKGVSCNKALRIERRAVDAISAGLPIDWTGRVGRWKCKYVNTQGPGIMTCSKGKMKFRISTAA